MLKNVLNLQIAVIHHTFRSGIRENTVGFSTLISNLNPPNGDTVVLKGEVSESVKLKDILKKK